MEITPYEINLIEVVQKVIFFEHALIDKTKKLPPLHAKDESLTSAVPPLLMIHHPTRCPVTGALSGFAAGRSGIGFEEVRLQILTAKESALWGPLSSPTGPVITFYC
ncbi:hypothetical protein KB559_06080 [Paenibacillus sp. Marseille-P2973]|uniref:hypothetical protein n=1 Tax=Paenibacillus sp. Marseille-P2973 TaxID=1871032 RepID=UPI001B36536A|nr:hypothetical protein [Paenibacillus sp. Marseille-P2973]MBQ4898403.1 hypothetical protein [Paenibacillus sp. Marseille-P2973]